MRKLVRQLEAESAGRGVTPQLLDPEYAANLDQLLEEEGGSGDEEDGEGSDDEGLSEGDDDEQGLGASGDDSEGLGLEEDMEEQEQGE